MRRSLWLLLACAGCSGGGSLNGNCADGACDECAGLPGCGSPCEADFSCPGELVCNEGTCLSASSPIDLELVLDGPLTAAVGSCVAVSLAATDGEGVPLRLAGPI